MTHASLFSGIGGFDLAAEWMGWDNIFHCEWNPFGQRVLAHHFPNSKSYNDITKTDFSIHAGQIDVLTGGFPCQPYSSAGKRLGKADERHLFPHMLRCVKEVKPKYVIGENVRGLVNWNGGLVFHEVQDDLEREGYEVQSFLIPAASVNAPHQRYRIWFVAFNSKSQRSASFREFCQGQNDESIGIRGDDKKNDVANTTSIGFREHSEGERLQSKASRTQFRMDEENATDSECSRLEFWDKTRNIRGEEGKTQIERSGITNEFKTNGYDKWESFPTEPPICGGDDGLPKELDNITFSKWRKESIKAAGNAIVPQVAHEIFKTIEKFENSL
jgi:DNA (cytosine-5)-methyltransferase 1